MVERDKKNQFEKCIKGRVWKHALRKVALMCVARAASFVTSRHDPTKTYTCHTCKASFKIGGGVYYDEIYCVACAQQATPSRTMNFYLSLRPLSLIL